VNDADLFTSFARRAATAPQDACEALRELLELRARQKDGELKNLLLKQLVVKYARLEQELEARQRQLQEDLKAAGEIQRSLLPQAATRSSRVQAVWRFQPCERVGGDCLDLFFPAPGLLCGYILDVSGHGVPSAMIAVSVVQALRPGNAACQLDSRGACDDVSPAQVLQLLDNQFPLERFDRHFTLSFFTLHEQTGELRYASAGHPPPVLLNAAGGLRLLEEGGPVIGLGISPFEEGRVLLEPEDRLFLYTDGVTECESPLGEFFGEERLFDLLRQTRDVSLEQAANALEERIRDFCGGRPPRDDITLLALEFLRDAA